jgi:hypothetical protein
VSDVYLLNYVINKLKLIIFTEIKQIQYDKMSLHIINTQS